MDIILVTKETRLVTGAKLRGVKVGHTSAVLSLWGKQHK